MDVEQNSCSLKKPAADCPGFGTFRINFCYLKRGDINVFYMLASSFTFRVHAVPLTCCPFKGTVKIQPSESFLRPLLRVLPCPSSRAGSAHALKMF